MYSTTFQFTGIVATSMAVVLVACSPATVMVLPLICLILQVYPLAGLPVIESTESPFDIDDMIGVRTKEAQAILNPEPSKYMAAVKEEWLWPGGVIPYEITANFSSIFVAKLSEAMATIEEVSCIRFVHYNETIHKEKLEIEAVPRACRSTVGRMRDTENGNKLHMELDDSRCVLGNMVHELIHTVGFEHEHTRKDREEALTVKTENIIKDKGVNFEVASYTETLTPYDFASIMHYPAFGFSNNGEPVLVPKQPLNGTIMGQRNHLSAYDIVKINRHYHCYETENCQDKLPNCEELSMRERVCEKFAELELLDNCMRTCGMCRLLKTKQDMSAKKE